MWSVPMQHQIRPRRSTGSGTMDVDQACDYQIPPNPNLTKLLEVIQGNGSIFKLDSPGWSVFEILLQTSNFSTVELTSGLLAAAEVSNLVVFDQLIRAGANISLLQAKDAMNVLVNNRREPNLPLLDRLLKGGLNPNCKNAKGFTPLWFSASLGLEEYVLKLLENGALVDTRNGYSMSTALHIACRHSFVGITQILLSFGANVNVTTSHGCTALHFAAKALSMGCVHEVLEAGADPNVRDTTSFCCTPLYNVIVSYQVGGITIGPIFDALVRHGVDVNAAVGVGSPSPLKMAIEYRVPLDSVKKLVDRDTILDKCDPLSPLHIAAKSLHYDVVRWLISRNCCVNVTTSIGETPLHVAVSVDRPGNQKMHVCRALIDAGSNINAVDREGCTPLMKVSGLRHACLLLDCGANPDHRDKHGRTPLSIAMETSDCRPCTQGCYVQNEMVRLLLKYNCDPDSRQPDMMNPTQPIFRALYNGDVKVAKMLYIAGCSLHNLKNLKCDLEERDAGRFRDALEWLGTILMQPRTLKSQAIFAIRKTLRWPKWDGTCPSQLPVPSVLQDYITLPELEHDQDEALHTQLVCLHKYCLRP